ncbi:MAG: hypothetical protein U1E46_15070 [Hyphomicrobiales bacterium]
MSPHRKTAKSVALAPRFLCAQAAGGCAVGLGLLDVMIACNVFDLHRMLAGSDSTTVACAMLAVAFASTFSAAAFATALGNIPTE